MSSEAILTSKGQTTIPKEIRDANGQSGFNAKAARLPGFVAA